MILVGFRGMTAEPDSQIIGDIHTYHIGSIVLFDYDVQTKKAVRNIESPAQVRKLTTQLQAASKIPLLIAVDQEGGKVNRLKPTYGFPPSLTADSLGKINNLDSTFARATIIAQTLRKVGINLNFAPDVDLNINPDNPAIGKKGRSFSADPAVVSNQARAYIQAHHRVGILTAIKHFPGHGSAWNDSHLGLADVTDTWQSIELEPYQSLIASGDCDIVMTAHVFQGHLDSLYPATLSRLIITGMLREKLHYKGVIISDDMQMGAITTKYGQEEAIRLALNAGVDILLFGNNLVYDPQIAEKAFTTVKKLVKAGKISKKRVRQSYRRIMKLKRKLY